MKDAAYAYRFVHDVSKGYTLLNLPCNFDRK